MVRTDLRGRLFQGSLLEDGSSGADLGRAGAAGLDRAALSLRFGSERRGPAPRAEPLVNRDE